MAAGRHMRVYRTSWGEELQGFNQISPGRWRISATGERFSERDERKAVQRYKDATQQHAVVRIDGAMTTRTNEAKTVATSGGEPVRLSQAKAEALQQAITPPEGATVINRALRIGYDIPIPVVAEWLREQLTESPEALAKLVGIPELAGFRHLPIPKKALRLAALLETYQKHSTASDDAKQLASNTFREFMRITGAATLADLTTENLRTYREAIMKRLSSPSSIAAYFSRVRYIIRFGKSEGLDAAQIDAALSKLELLKAPKDDRMLQPSPISASDMAKLMKTAKADYGEWYARLLLCLNCCLHFGEALDVQWDELNLEAKTFVSRRSKTGNVVRAAVLWAETVAALKSIKRTGSPFVFTSKHGTKFNAKGQWKTWEKLRKDAGTPDVQLDDIRDGAYSAACACSGVDERFARLYAGHRSHGLQDNYVVRNPQLVAPACDAVRKAYAEALKA